MARHIQATQKVRWSLVVVAVMPILCPLLLTTVDQSEAAALAIGLRVILSMLSLVLLLYLPTVRWIERKLTAAPS
jgi:hypothetical protein